MSTTEDDATKAAAAAAAATTDDAKMEDSTAATVAATKAVAASSTDTTDNDTTNAVGTTEATLAAAAAAAGAVVEVSQAEGDAPAVAAPTPQDTAAGGIQLVPEQSVSVSGRVSLLSDVDGQGKRRFFPRVKHLIGNKEWEDVSFVMCAYFCCVCVLFSPLLTRTIANILVSLSVPYTGPPVY